MKHPAPMAESIDTLYEGLTLKARRYRLDPDGLAQIHDDGIVDDVAVKRAADGDKHVRLTPREVICAVHVLAARGRTDSEIADILGYQDSRRVYDTKTRNAA